MYVYVNGDNFVGSDHAAVATIEILYRLSSINATPDGLRGLDNQLKLADFGITAEVVAVYPGPVITRFEIQPAAGVKVSRISNLAKDLARSLAVISVRVPHPPPDRLPARRDRGDRSHAG